MSSGFQVVKTSRLQQKSVVEPKFHLNFWIFCSGNLKGAEHRMGVMLIHLEYSYKSFFKA